MMRYRYPLLAMLVSLGLIAMLGNVLLGKIENMATANSDNLQWTLSRKEVEYLQFERALIQAMAGEGDLRDVRRRFDVLYSRHQTLTNGTTFRDLRQGEEVQKYLDRISAFLESAIPLIDGPDDALRAALPELMQRAKGIETDIREIGFTGLNIFAETSDSRRQEVFYTLIVMTVVLGIVLCALVLIAGMLLVKSRWFKLRSREFQATAAQLRTVVDTSLDAIIVTDEDGIIRDYNRAARQIFGYDAEEACGQIARDLLFPTEDVEELRQTRLAFLDENRRPEPQERVLELTAVDKSGRAFPAEVSIDRARQEQDPVFVAIIRDISRRRAAEDGLNKALDRALAGERTKAEFLAVMSHEMRTPLNGLLGTMDLMRDHSLTERQSDLLDRMQASGRSLLTLVNDVLDLAKFEAGKMRFEPRAFSVAWLADGVIGTAAPLAAANDIELGWSWVGEPVDTVTGDPRRLRQILLNLVGNAVKFTHDGAVEMEIEAIGTDRGTLEFRVIDTGIGISSENLDRIFEDFETLDSSYSREAGGTGLGLGITRRLVELLGGEIGVESEPGEGSLFWVRLPLPQSDEAPAPGRSTSPRPSLGTQSLDLLLVEDNEINRFVAREMLVADGHRVTEAINGRAGVDRAAAHRFDAILMDISMPEMDGPEAARRIRAGDGASAKVPIIAVTAHALPEEVARFREAGMDAWISKPLDRAHLMETLARLSRSTPEAEPAPESPGPRVVNHDQLSEVRAQLGEDTFRELRDRLIRESEPGIAGLADPGLSHADLAAQAHRIAGSCATFGLEALRAQLAAIETAALKGRGLDAGAHQALSEMWRRSKAELEAL